MKLVLLKRGSFLINVVAEIRAAEEVLQ